MFQKALKGAQVLGKALNHTHGTLSEEDASKASLISAKGVRYGRILPPDLRSEVVQRLCERLEHESGETFFSVSVDDLPLRVGSVDTRCFMRCKFRSGTQLVTLFVKSGHASNIALQQFIGRTHNAYFVAPRLLDPFRIDEEQFLAWMFLDGYHPRFEDLAVWEKDRIAAGIAGIALHTQATLGAGVKVRVETMWSKPVMGHILADTAFVKKMPAEMLKQAELYARLEPRLIASILNLEPKYLTHNDIKQHNVLILPDDARLGVIDWESARLSPAGCGLRYWAASSDGEQTEMVSRYVKAMIQGGEHVTFSDVKLAMDVQKIMWGVSTGYRRRSRYRMASAFALSQRLFVQV